MGPSGLGPGLRCDGRPQPFAHWVTGCLPAEPSFVFSDVVRESPDSTTGGDDRVFFFFTEVSVEYEFVFKLLIPRVARVCKVSPIPHCNTAPCVPLNLLRLFGQDGVM